MRKESLLRSARAFLKIGRNHCVNGRFALALAPLQQAVRLAPNDDEIHFVLARAFADLGRLDQAIVHFAKVTTLNPRHADAFDQLGIAFIRLNRLVDAIGCFAQVVRLRPDLASARSNLANALCETGRVHEAIEHYQQGLRIDPDNHMIRCNLGNALRLQGRAAEAVSQLKIVTANAPGMAAAYQNLGLAQRDMDCHAEAIASLEQALAIEPDNSNFHFGLGIVRAEVGDFAGAEHATETAIKLSPQTGRFYRVLGDLRPLAQGDQIIRHMEQLLAGTALPAQDRMELHFALGKAYDDLGRAEAAFEQLVQGNALKRANLVYDEAGSLALIERIKAVFTSRMLQRQPIATPPGITPIFIVGMPRSGTTLMEQILASHPSVSGVGENPALDQLTKSLTLPFPDDAAHLTDKHLFDIGVAYKRKILDGVPPDMTHAVNKMPANFMLAGLIALALPDARIIHATRDPVDTCLSCFSKLFNFGQMFTYDLGELGRYWQAYDRMMQHWRKVLPPGIMIDVAYEDVVGDLAGQTRRMLDHCGLDWHDGCLRFYDTERVVRTASSSQVRRPLYRSSVGRWQAYGKDRLKPLLDSLFDQASC